MEKNLCEAVVTTMQEGLLVLEVQARTLRESGSAADRSRGRAMEGLAGRLMALPAGR